MSPKTTEPTSHDLATECERLRAENAHLTALLARHGIPHRQNGDKPTEASRPPSVSSASLSTDEKIALFRRLFRGRDDAYPVRWESRNGRSGYSPACANEWRAGVCEKPRIKCGECNNRPLIALTDKTIYDHLAGNHTVGVYPLEMGDILHFRPQRGAA